MKNNDTVKHNMSAQVILYVICAALVIFYCLDLWWGIRPSVGIEYKMYYITHELTDWPGYGNLKYTYGTKEICIERNENTIANTNDVICARKGQGFEKATMAGAKSKGKDSYVYYLTESEAQNAVLHVDITEFNGEAVNVYAGDNCIGSMTAAGSYTFNVGLLKSGELVKIHFENNNSVYTLYSIELDA